MDLYEAFADRAEAGRLLARELERERGPDLVVLGLARGGVQVAAEVARVLEAPLDAVAVRKIGHPYEPEYALGAATTNGRVYLRSDDGLSQAELDAAVEKARAEAAALDRRLHRDRRPLELAGKTVLLVDDGLATGATMIAALRWARSRGARRMVVAIPVAAASSLVAVRAEADDIACPAGRTDFGAISLWYRDFPQVSDEEVVALLEEAAQRVELAAR